MDGWDLREYLASIIAASLGDLRGALQQGELIGNLVRQ